MHRITAEGGCATLAPRTLYPIACTLPKCRDRRVRLGLVGRVEGGAPASAALHRFPLQLSVSRLPMPQRRRCLGPLRGYVASSLRRFLIVSPFRV
jgi:hypothetical protein